MDIPDQFQEIGILVTNDGFVSSLEEMTCRAVFSIEVHGIALLKPLHHLGKRRFTLFNQQMNMVRHQNISVERTEAAPLIGDQAVQVLLVVFLSAKNLLALVPPCNDMIKSSLIFYTRLPGHASSITELCNGVNIKISMSDPKWEEVRVEFVRLPESLPRSGVVPHLLVGIAQIIVGGRVVRVLGNDLFEGLHGSRIVFAEIEMQGKVEAILPGPDRHCRREERDDRQG